MFGIPVKTLVIGGAAVVVVGAFSFQDGGVSFASSSTSTQCQVTVNADLLKVRSAASTAASVVEKIKNGDTFVATKTVQNGFRQLSSGKWASTQFLTVKAGTPC